MSGQGMSEVGQLNAISLQKGGGTPKVETPPPTARTISWKLNPVWTVGDIIKATDITVSAGPANAVQTAPPLVAQTKGGITVDVTAEAPADGGFARATKTETVTVNKTASATVTRSQVGNGISNQAAGGLAGAVNNPQLNAGNTVTSGSASNSAAQRKTITVLGINASSTKQSASSTASRDRKSVV